MSIDYTLMSEDSAKAIKETEVRFPSVLEELAVHFGLPLQEFKASCRQLKQASTEYDAILSQLESFDASKEDSVRPERLKGTFNQARLALDCARYYFDQASKELMAKVSVFSLRTWLEAIDVEREHLGIPRLHTCHRALDKA